MEKVLVGEVEKLSVASTAKLVVVAADGVPEITPVLEFKERPPGREPETTEKLGVPWEFAVLIVVE